MAELEMNLNENQKGTLDLFVEGKRIGFMEVIVKEGTLTVFHTEVEPEGRGKGYAKNLFDKLISYARENNLTIIPLCPYVHGQFEKEPDMFKDVWKKE